jgi:hypothetical protein
LFLSFNYISGVETVDDLLERIDDAIERAKIVVNNGKEKGALNKGEGENTPDAASGSGDSKEKEDEPIRIQFGDMHRIEDLIAAVNGQPGGRKVVLEGAPDELNTVSMKKTGNPSSAAAGGSKTTTIEKKDNPPSAADGGSKTTTIEKKDNPPSAADGGGSKTTTIEKKDNQPPAAAAGGSTKATVEKKDSSATVKIEENAPSSPEVDQIHVNIENVESVDDLLDRIDDAVQKVPVIIDTKPRGDKKKGLFIFIQYSLLTFFYLYNFCSIRSK